MIYFIQASESVLIKIGYTENAVDRLNAIRASSPERVYTLKIIEGSRDDEHNLHIEFQHLKERGEWFHPGKDLLDFVREAEGMMHELRRSEENKGKWIKRGKTFEPINYFVQTHEGLIRMGRAERDEWEISDCLNVFTQKDNLSDLS